MKRERLFENNVNRFVVYPVCIMVMFIALLVLGSNVPAQVYDTYYKYLGFDPALSSMSYQYQSVNEYFDRYAAQTGPVNLGMATAQYTYSHMSGASAENTYLYNVYMNPYISAAPASQRNTLYQFWASTGGQSNYPGSGPGSFNWVPQAPGPSSPSPKPKMPFPVPQFWPTYNMPSLWTSIGGGLPSIDVWSPVGGYSGAMGGAPSVYSSVQLWQGIGGLY